MDAFKDTPLIAISGYGQPSDVEKAIDSGFDHHLLKPYGIEELVALLTA
jgi:two-component system CheB/CheR fusion protein